jgi:hypothetical protein
MLTAAARDQQISNPGQLDTEVRTFIDELFLCRPRITRRDERMPSVVHIDVECIKPGLATALRKSEEELTRVEVLLPT